MRSSGRSSGLSECERIERVASSVGFWFTRPETRWFASSNLPLRTRQRAFKACKKLRAGCKADDRKRCWQIAGSSERRGSMELVAFEHAYNDYLPLSTLL